MKILITGANGFLGQHLCHFFSKNDHDLAGVSLHKRRLPVSIPIEFFQADITDKKQINTVIETVRPDVIIHAAAMSKPDECEQNQQACLEHNVAATGFLLDSFKALNIPDARFVYLSTDFIFGENGPHSESDIPQPLNFYGQSKLMAEQLVTDSPIDCCIVRPVFIYGRVWEGLRPSFLHWVKNNLEQNKAIKVVSDQQRTPTFVNDICEGIEQLIVQKRNGVYHLAGKDILSPYQMAVTTAEVLGLDAGLIESVTSETFPEPVRRAKKSGLNIDKSRKELKYDPVDFKEGVRQSFK